MNDMEISTIGERIKTLRKKRGYNQKELADLLGKSLRTIQKYESGEIEVSMKYLLLWSMNLPKCWILLPPIFWGIRPAILNLTAFQM